MNGRRRNGGLSPVGRSISEFPLSFASHFPPRSAMRFLFQTHKIAHFDKVAPFLPDHFRDPCDPWFGMRLCLSYVESAFRVPGPFLRSFPWNPLARDPKGT